MEAGGCKGVHLSPSYLNKEKEIYPGVLEAAEELNSGSYVEAIMTGGIGSGRPRSPCTPMRTSCTCSRACGIRISSLVLDPSSEILLVFQSITKQLARGVDYQRFRNMIEGSPYFHKHYPFQQAI